MVYSLLGVTHSWLSREVMCLGGFGFFTLAGVIDDYLNTGFLFQIYIMAVVFALATTFTIGFLYKLKAQPTWGGWGNKMAPLVTALLIGMCIHLPNTHQPWMKITFLLLWLVDFQMANLRIFRLIKYLRNHSHPPIASWALLFYCIRILVSMALLVWMLLFFDKIPQYLAMALVLLDRTGLYMGAVPLSPGEEIDRIKSQRMEAAVKGQN